MPSIKQLVRKIWHKPLRSSDEALALGTATRETFSSSTELIDHHFSEHSDAHHPCHSTMARAIELLGEKPAHIIETGSSAWGTNSSLLFDAYVNSFGGTFESVDIRPEPARALGVLCCPNSRFFCDDSVSFLKRVERERPPIDLLYLDSWDLDWSDPLPSALHGLNEFLSIYPALRPGSLILIDDTPLNANELAHAHPNQVEDYVASSKKFGFSPGKGSLVKLWLRQQSIGQELAHGYQLLWRL